MHHILLEMGIWGFESFVTFRWIGVNTGGSGGRLEKTLMMFGWFRGRWNSGSKRFLIHMNDFPAYIIFARKSSIIWNILRPGVPPKNGIETTRLDSHLNTCLITWTVKDGWGILEPPTLDVCWWYFLVGCQRFFKDISGEIWPIDQRILNQSQLKTTTMPISVYAKCPLLRWILDCKVIHLVNNLCFKLKRFNWFQNLAQNPATKRPTQFNHSEVRVSQAAKELGKKVHSNSSPSPPTQKK